MQFLCTATGVFVFCVLGGKTCTETEREREGEGKGGREGVSRNDGGKYKWERKVDVFNSFGFFFLLLLLDFANRSQHTSYV